MSLIAPDSFEAERYRVLRTALERMHEDGRSSVIAVSSPSIGDGKTTTAINLAATLAQGPTTRVLLVDADLRNPSVGPRLGLENPRGKGLVNAIREDGVLLEDVVTRRPPFELAVVPAGSSARSPHELLKSPRLMALINQARQQYDYVVLDTPPIVSFDDCQVIADCVDGFLIVVAAHRTPRKLVEEVLRVIDPAKLLGFVFNNDDRLTVSIARQRMW